MDNEQTDFARVTPKWKTWLFNPFMFIAGTESLVCGVAIIFLSGLLGYVCSVHFDGVLDIHKGVKLPLWFFMFESFAAWLCLAAVLFVFAKVLYPKTRIIDLFGTQALARWPYIFAPMLRLPRAYQNLQTSLTKGQTVGSLAPIDLAIVLIGSIFIVAISIWTVYLMYKAFAVSCNAKGPKGIAQFAFALVIGEIISKIVIAAVFASAISN